MGKLLRLPARNDKRLGHRDKSVSLSQGEQRPDLFKQEELLVSRMYQLLLCLRARSFASRQYVVERER